MRRSCSMLVLMVGGLLRHGLARRSAGPALKTARMHACAFQRLVAHIGGAFCVHRAELRLRSSCVSLSFGSSAVSGNDSDSRYRCVGFSANRRQFSCLHALLRLMQRPAVPPSLPRPRTAPTDGPACAARMTASGAVAGRSGSLCVFADVRMPRCAGARACRARADQVRPARPSRLGRLRVQRALPHASPLRLGFAVSAGAAAATSSSAFLAAACSAARRLAPEPDTFTSSLGNRAFHFELLVVRGTVRGHHRVGR